MALAQIMIENNCVHVGDKLKMRWNGVKGITYTIRYAFGSISDVYVTYDEYALGKTGSVGFLWLIPEEFGTEMGSAKTMDGTLYLDSYNGSTLIGTTSATFTIAEKSIIIPTLSSYEIDAGKELTITAKSANMFYTPKLTYSIGSRSGEINMDKGGSYGSSTYTKAWTIPMDFASEFPTECSATLLIECATVRSFGGASTLGTVTLRVVLNIPKNESTRPKVTLTLSAVNDLNHAFDGLYIKGKTKVRAVMEAVSTYSQIQSYAISSGAKTVDATEATFDFEADQVSVWATATDARGFEGTATKSVTAYPYDRPRVVPADGENKVVCARCNSSGVPDPKGEYVLVKAGRKVSSISKDGVQLNFCKLRYRYKLASAQDYSSWTTLLEEDDPQNAVSQVLDGVVLSAKSAYTFQIGVIDTVGSYSDATIPVPATKKTLFHLGRGGKNVSVGQYCDYSHEDAFDIGFTTYFNKGVALHTIFEGAELGVEEDISTVVPDADVTAVGRYTLFVAVSGDIPVPCAKIGNKIRGGSVKLHYEEVDGIGKLWMENLSLTVNALYALL